MTHDLASTVRALAADLRQDTGPVPLPATVDEVVAVAERTDGVLLADLLAALQPDAKAVDAALAEILRAAAEPPATGDHASKPREEP